MINDAKIAIQILTTSYAQDRDLTSIGVKPDDRDNFNLFATEDNTPSFINLNGQK